MPAICKYFLQGNCRYGDNCRFYHPEDNEEEEYDENYDDGQTYRGQQQQPQQRYAPQQPRGNVGHFGSRTDQRQGNYQDRQGHFQDRQGQFQDRQGHFQDRQGYIQDRQGNFQDRQGNSQDRQQLMTSGRRVSSSASSGYGSARDASQYKWVSPLRRESSEQQQERHQTSQQLLSVVTKEQYSAPMSQASPAREAEDYADMIMNDMQTWIESNQWVFSCYGFAGSKPCSFGFPDYSFEELRAEALEARMNGKGKEHRQKLVDLERSYNSLQRRLLSLNDFQYEQLIHGVNALLKRSSSNGKVDFGPDLTFKYPSSSRRGSSSASVQPQQSQPSNDRSSAGPTGPSGFSFALPLSQDSRRESTSTDIFYTPMDRLSEEEKAAFKRPTFQSGAVPIQPPAVEFCK